MLKNRAYELAKELNVASKEIIEKAKRSRYFIQQPYRSTMEEAEISKLKELEF